jgi:hypothetical protein
VDCLPDIRRIAEERIEIFPVRPPAFADLRIFIVPNTRECSESQNQDTGMICFHFSPYKQGDKPPALSAL